MTANEVSRLHLRLKGENEMDNAEVLKEKKTFKLLDEPISFQLSHHFNNLMTYFHPENMNLRKDGDENYSYHIVDILATFEWLIANPQYGEQMLETNVFRFVLPMEFRVAQIVQHYGVETIKNYIKLIYGKGKVG